MKTILSVLMAISLSLASASTARAEEGLMKAIDVLIKPETTLIEVKRAITEAKQGQASNYQRLTHKASTRTKPPATTLAREVKKQAVAF